MSKKLKHEEAGLMPTGQDSIRLHKLKGHHISEDEDLVLQVHACSDAL